MKTKGSGEAAAGTTKAGPGNEDPLDILLAKIRTQALGEMSRAAEGDGIEKLLRSSLLERYESSTDESHLLERWVTGELIRMIASGKR